MHQCVRVIMLAMLPIAVGCGSSVRMVTIVSTPPEAIINVDGDRLGQTPVDHDFDFRVRGAYHIEASKAGYFDLQRVITRDTPELRQGILRMVLEEDVAWLNTTTNQATNRWLKIQISDGITKEQMWQRIISSVTNNYDTLEQMDPYSGYIRSTCINRRYYHPNYADYAIRTQFFGAIDAEDPLMYKVKVVSEHTTGGGQWGAHDRIFKSDAQLIEELQNRLGTKERARELTAQPQPE